MTTRSVGVVGAGTMGNGIAQVFAQAGFNVIMTDVSQAALDRGLAAISSSLSRLVKKGVFNDNEAVRKIVGEISVPLQRHNGLPLATSATIRPT